ncbi:MAG TPA: hypothetical protein VIW29_10570, partial [Polyangiaceae bacterium]
VPTDGARARAGVLYVARLEAERARLIRVRLEWRLRRAVWCTEVRAQRRTPLTMKSLAVAVSMPSFGSSVLQSPPALPALASSGAV